MMGKTHRFWGAHVGAAGTLAMAPGEPHALAVAACSGLAYLTATWPDRVEVVGFGHRRATHHWAIPALVLIGGVFCPWPISWLLQGVGLGWLSHIIGDFMFGKAHTRDLPGGGFVVIRGRGVPAPFKYRGLGFKVNGKGEKWLCRILVRTMVPWVFMCVAYATWRMYS